MGNELVGGAKPELEQVISEALGDDDIKRFLPNSKIIKYSELSRYKTIDDLLTGPKDYAFVLYEDSPNKGHWTAVSRPDADTIEFFDSYGGKPDSQQKWTPLQMRLTLGEGRPLLTTLFDASPYKVQYNPVQYQKDGPNISDCGRHCVCRVGCMLEGMSLADYYKTLKKLKAKSGQDYDEIVSSLVQ